MSERQKGPRKSHKPVKGTEKYGELEKRFGWKLGNTTFELRKTVKIAKTCSKQKNHFESCGKMKKHIKM